MRMVVYVETNMVGSRVEDEFDLPEDWDKWSDKDRDEYLIEAAKHFLYDSVDYGAYIKED